MSDLQKHHPTFENLRQQAEILIQKQPDLVSDIPSESDVLDLVHEVKIQNTELNLQNEELKRAQQEIVDLKNEYEDLYEFAPCGYLTLNNKGMITRANLTAVKILGEPRSILHHSSLSQFIDKRYDSAWRTAQKNAGRTGEKQTADLKLKSDEPTPPVVRAEITVDRDGSDSVVQWRIVLVDISEQYSERHEKRGIEKELRQARKMESIGTLAGGIAHEFNNLLQTILGNNQVLLDKLPDARSLRKNSKEIQVAGFRARDVVKQLLTFSRKNDAEKKPMDFRQVVQDSMKLIRSSTPRQIEISQIIPDNIYPVLCNDTQINQILINLCSNARDAIADNAGTITIELSNDILDETFAKNHPPLKPVRYVKLSVRDNGCGVNQKHIEKIFDPFFTTKEGNKGTGIGLSVVYGIVKNHDGLILVESSPGKETVFTILLPAYGGSIDPSIGNESIRPAGNESILYVEDEPAILELGKLTLERLGYRVCCFEDPLEALEEFKSSPSSFDILITDMGMPMMTGDKLIGEIRKIRPDIPTILCTGYSQAISEEIAGELGINAFLMKPVSTIELAAKIRKTLNTDQ